MIQSMRLAALSAVASCALSEPPPPSLSVPSPSAEDTCTQVTRMVDEHTAVSGCQQDVEAWPTLQTRPATHTLARMGGGPPVLPRNCRYVSSNAIAAELLQLCAEDEHIFSGGCYVGGASLLIDSTPFEASSPDDTPDDGEAFEDTDVYSGWTCRRASGGSDRVGTSALCCR
ncbi:MAG: hypothetical protein KTR31_34800 [Myxococcales bacterium]|nr:hypothetical protein [Myxococcales bacterium]